MHACTSVAYNTGCRGHITQAAGVIAQAAGVITQAAGVITQAAGVITQVCPQFFFFGVCFNVYCEYLFLGHNTYYIKTMHNNKSVTDRFLD